MRPGNALWAVDIGNSSVDIGLFEPGEIDCASNTLPRPIARHKLKVGHLSWADLQAIRSTNMRAAWYISSVNRQAETELESWRGQVSPPPDWHTLQASDFPLSVSVRHPEQLGLDRRAAATAALRLRGVDEGLLIIDVGTAITINLLDRTGCFRGGAILPGLGLAARSLAEGTDRLPHLEFPIQSSPSAVGTDTIEAMQAGIYWGKVGAIHELVNRIQQTLPAPPRILITGGGAALLLAELRFAVDYLPDLVLSGIALAAAGRNAC